MKINLNTILGNEKLSDFEIMNMEYWLQQMWLQGDLIYLSLSMFYITKLLAPLNVTCIALDAQLELQEKALLYV